MYLNCFNKEHLGLMKKFAPITRVKNVPSIAGQENICSAELTKRLIRVTFKELAEWPRQNIITQLIVPQLK